jgi:hypothetical protein
MTTERTQQHLYELNTESRITKLESVNESILRTLSSIDTKIDKLDNRLWFLYAWTGAGFAAILTVIARGMEWI